ncbi:MAG TPA: hypothetical protein VIA06_02665 [Candidatus Dormibacteraeota bacterium]|jgi:hypothetical protein|nr:hypothetical protein [Candidatus Dormibacteraeota bacterium]
MNLNMNQVRSLLKGIKEEATTASLTGALEGGHAVMAQVFNRCRQALVDAGDGGVTALFPEFSDKAAVDEIGVAAALLLRYVAAPAEEVGPAAEEARPPAEGTGPGRA